MLQNNRRSIPLFILLLVSSTPICSINGDSPIKDVVIGLAAATGVVAIGAGLWSYFCSQTPEQVLQEDRNFTQDLLTKYTSHMDIAFSEAIGHTAPAHLSESAVHRYAQLNTQNKCLYIDSDIQAITKALEKSNYALQKTSTYQTEVDLKLIIADLMNIRTELLYLKDVATVHASYFNLADTHKAMVAAYRNECSILHTLPVALGYQIKEHINVCLHMRHLRYPYFEFAQLLRSDITTLQTMLARSSHNYPQLNQQAKDLLQDLTFLHCFIINEPEYQRDAYAYEQAERERERLRLERIRVEMEHQRLREEQERRRQEQRRWEEEQRRREYERQCALARINPHVDVEIVITQETTKSDESDSYTVCNRCGLRDCCC